MLDLDIIAGRLIVPEVVITPIVLRRDLSCAESGWPIRELAAVLVLGGAIDILEGRMFSIFSDVVGKLPLPPSLPLVLDFLLGRTGRVGGLLIVVPVVRAVILFESNVDATDGLVDVGCCVAVVASFFDSSAVVAFIAAAGRFAPVALRCSISSRLCLSHLP